MRSLRLVSSTPATWRERWRRRDHPVLAYGLLVALIVLCLAALELPLWWLQ